VKEEFHVASRKMFYESLETFDVDEHLAFYNRERADPGYRTQGRTPDQAVTASPASFAS
jgi:hypothetical protein